MSPKHMAWTLGSLELPDWVPAEADDQGTWRVLALIGPTCHVSVKDAVEDAGSLMLSVIQKT